MEFISELSTRNPALFYFGLLSLLCAMVSLNLSWITNTQVLGINAWVKPTKFFLSTTIFVWSMAWYMHYLSQQNQVAIYSWVVILVLAFELIWISWQAFHGQMSHFNVSTKFNSTMWSLMGMVISIMTLHTAYIGILFFMNSFPELPLSYLWAIRIGIILFVMFAFEGGLMGAKMSHTIGAEDGTRGLPFLNWSVSKGDLRIAHFIGMHALQVLPIIAFFLIKDVKLIAIIGFLYFVLASFVLYQALLAKPLLRL